MGPIVVIALVTLVALAGDPPSFISVHAPDGKAISINAGEISSLRDPRAGQYGPAVKCVVVMTNRSFLGVIEDCRVVHQLLHEPTAAHAPCTLVCAGTERP